MADKPLKALLITGDLEAIALLEEAFTEIEEIRYSRGWIPRCELVPVERLEEALAALASEPFDVILLDASLLDGRLLEAFARLRAAARELPLIILVEPEEEAQAVSLLRRGAQDYLIKAEIDCLPLARTLRAAIERQRLWNALESLALLDELTGLLTAAGLAQFAERHARLAAAAGRSVQLLVVELEREHEIGDLLRAAETLTALFSETGLVGRTAAARLVALAVTERPVDLIRLLHERLAGLAWRAAAVAWPSDSGACLEDVVDACEQLLCENEPSQADSPTHALALDDRPRRHLQPRR